MEIAKDIAVAVIFIGLFTIRLIRYKKKWANIDVWAGGISSESLESWLPRQ